MLSSVKHFELLLNMKGAIETNLQVFWQECCLLCFTVTCTVYSAQYTVSHVHSCSH